MMERVTSAGVRVLVMLAVAALPELACCHVAVRALPPTVVCEAEGRLPDPTDCRYYMDCTSNGDGTYSHTISPCPDGTYYDSCQGACTITEQPNNCSVTCNTVGIPIASTNNPSVYFSCVRDGEAWDVHVWRCPNGNAFDETNGCNGGVVDCPVNGGSSGPSTCNATGYYGDDENCSVYYYCSSAGATPQSVSCGTDQYYITYNHSCVEFQCASEGWFADPANCSWFYSCVRGTSDYDKTHIECPRGSHFDSSVGTCLIGDCTTTCPGSSGSTGTNFTCTSSGFFADPLNCSSYYYCDSSLNATHVYCPAGSHFDSTVGGCLLGGCNSTGTAFTCTSSGIFADPRNCSSYYYCDSSLNATHIVCPAGSHFDSTVGGCLLGTCSNRLVATGLQVALQSLHSISSLSLKREEATIPVWNSHRGTLQLPSA